VVERFGGIPEEIVTEGVLTWPWVCLSSRINDGSSVTRNFFMGVGLVVRDGLVSVSKRKMGEDGLVMAVMVLTVGRVGTKSSWLSLSSVSR